MATRPNDNYIGDNARTQGEAKTHFETMRDFLVSLLGGDVEASATLSSDAFTPDGTKNSFAITSQTGTADDLKNITTTNLPDGSIALIRGASGHTITIKHAAGGAGQINLSDAADRVLSTSYYVMLMRRGTDWYEVMRSFVPQATSQDNLVLLATYTPSGASSVNMTSVLSSTYKRYRVTIDDLRISSDDKSLRMRASINNGSTWIATGYEYAGNGRGSGGSNQTIDSTAGGTTFWAISNQSAGIALSSASGDSYSGSFELADPNTAASRRMTINGSCCYRSANSNTQHLAMSGSLTGQSSAVNALQLLPEVGTITGTIKIYGLK